MNYPYVYFLSEPHMLVLFDRDQLTIALFLTVNGRTTINIDEIFESYVIKLATFLIWRI